MIIRLKHDRECLEERNQNIEEQNSELVKKVDILEKEKTLLKSNLTYRFEKFEQY